MSYTAILLLVIMAVYPAVSIPLLVYDYIQVIHLKRKLQS